MNSLLDVVYEDEHYVAIDKPPGLLVHRSPVDRRETVFAIQLLRDQLGYHVYPAHRLDKPTSGILLFAKSRDALSAIRSQFENHEVCKGYLALVRGFAPENLRIDHPVKTRVDDRDQRLQGEPKDGITDLRCRQRYEIPVQIGAFPTSRYSLVELQPLTGRRHQLRYHMKHISHPIIGDSSYGKGVHNRFFQEHYHCHRLLLMANRLEFRHPVSAEQISIEVPPSGSFAGVLDQLEQQSGSGGNNGSVST